MACRSFYVIVSLRRNLNLWFNKFLFLLKGQSPNFRNRFLGFLSDSHRVITLPNFFNMKRKGIKKRVEDRFILGEARASISDDLIDRLCDIL